MTHKNFDFERAALDDSTVLIHSWAKQVRVDAQTAEVVRALRASGIRPMLLKGPVIAHWLYSEEPSIRSYVDTDLLVSPDDHGVTIKTLESLGFKRDLMPVLTLDPDNLVFRRADGANVDLHLTFHGLEELNPSQVWEVFVKNATWFSVGGEAVDVPDLPLRSLNVVLHLGVDEGPEAKSWRDLSRAIERVDLGTWASAAAIARELGAEPEMAVRLRRIPGGRDLADKLGLSTDDSLTYRLHGAIAVGSISPQVARVHRLHSMSRSPLTACKYAFQKVFPPHEQLLLDYPRLAQIGSLWVPVARVARACRVVSLAPKAFREYRKMKR